MSVGKADTKIVSRSPWQALEVLFWDTNTIRLLPVLASVVAYSVQVGNYWKGVAIYFGFLLFADVCYYNFAIPIFGPEAAIRRGYNLSGYFNDTLYSVGLDYGFNFYNGDYEKTRRQAQQDKFEYAFEHMGLKPGASVFDCGCGCGDWLNWLQTVKKCKVVGVNISSLQALECRERGLHVITSNWKTLDLEKEGLVGQFDAITFWDTVEHYINAKDRNNVKAQNTVYHQMYEMAQKLLKKDTPCGRIWISCLHMKGDLSGVSWFSWEKISILWYCYILDKFHSGSYPSADSDQLVTTAKDCGFKIIHRKDTTMDYYMTSVLEPTHFGKHVFSWNSTRIFMAIVNLFTDPNAIQRMIWYASSDWMLQFNEKDITKSDMVHWWLVFDRDNKRVK